MRRNSDQNVFWIGFGIFDENIKIAIIVKDAGVEKFVLHLFPRTSRVGLHKIPIGILALRILVQILHVRMRRCAVEIKVIFLDVFAMIAFVVGEAKQALLQNGISAVPKSKCE